MDEGQGCGGRLHSHTQERSQNVSVCSSMSGLESTDWVKSEGKTSSLWHHLNGKPKIQCKGTYVRDRNRLVKRTDWRLPGGGGGRRMNRGFGVRRCHALYRGDTQQGLIESVGIYSQHPGINCSGREYGETHNCITLLHGRNQYNTVNQLHVNNKWKRTRRKREAWKGRAVCNCSFPLLQRSYIFQFSFLPDTQPRR